jgi:hypothetical protein
MVAVGCAYALSLIFGYKPTNTQNIAAGLMTLLGLAVIISSIVSNDFKDVQ